MHLLRSVARRWQVIAFSIAGLFLFHLVVQLYPSGAHLKTTQEVSNGSPKPFEALQNFVMTTFGIVAVPSNSEDANNTPEITQQPAQPDIDSFNTVPGDTDEYVSMCVTAKNESMNLPEFFAHHYHHIGIRRFYIMDDGSEPPLSSYEYPIPKEAITWVYYTADMRHEHDNQLFLDSECNRLFGDRHTWMGFFDVDEYFEIINPPETLVDILHEMEQDPHIGALGVNWKIHTSSGLLTRQPSIRKAFTTCIWDDPEHDGEGSNNNRVKSFVKTANWGPNINPHVFHLTNDTIHVGEDGKPWPWKIPFAFRMPITRNRIALHHYQVKSREEYEEKMLRSQHIEAGKTTWDFFNMIEAMPHVDCPEMVRFNP